jgi:hypothetical protein
VGRFSISATSFLHYNAEIMRKINCDEAKKFDLIDYLAALGHVPAKIRNQDYWYRSPLRDEKTPSFKVNRKSNLWYDHGIGQGGDLIDFGTLYYHCTIPDLLERLSQYATGPSFSFQPPLASGLGGAGEKEGPPGGKIAILDTRPLSARPLIDYLLKRSIPPDIAARSCREVDFSLYDNRQTAIGFPNRSGGYELRSEVFKGSSSPKDISFFDNHTDDIAVFEGFFNYLSYLTLNRHNLAPLTNFLVLNSLAFLERSRPLMEQYGRINLLLDGDPAGRSFTRKALVWNPDKYFDWSDFYQGRKDLNEWLIHEFHQQPKLSQSPRKGRSI